MSNKAPNSSIIISGISGSGKTTRMLQLESHSVINGNTAIVIDTGCSHSKEGLQKLTDNEYRSRTFRISALSDGLNVKFLEPFAQENAQTEPDFMIINAATQALSQPLKLGAAQTAVLREGIIFAMEHKNDYTTEIEAIVAGLTQKGRTGYDVYNRLWTVFHCNAFRSGHQKMIKSGMINIIDLNDYENDIQRVIAEIILSYQLRRKRCQDSTAIYNVFLDECQRFSLDKNGIVCQLLREGRKFGINLILATQTLSTLGKDVQSILGQASTQLYFRPSQEDVHKIAKSLSATDWQLWKSRLTSLQVGECIASGVFNVNGQEINRPLLLR